MSWSRGLMGAAVAVGVSVAGGLVWGLVFHDGGEELAWAEQYGEITNRAAQAGLPVQRALLDLNLCSTDAECSEAVSGVEESLKPYIEVLDRSLVELSAIDPPTGRARELQRTMETSLETEKRWAELIQKCARTLDLATCQEADALYETLVRMQADVLDALEPFLEE